MKPLLISLIFISITSLLGFGFATRTEFALLDNSHYLSGFDLIVFLGLAGIGLVDLANWNEGVSHT